MSHITVARRTAFSSLRKFFVRGLALSLPALLATGCGPVPEGAEDETTLVVGETSQKLETETRTLSFSASSWTFHTSGNPGYPLFPSSTEAILLPDDRTNASIVAFYNQEVSPPYTVEFEYLTFDDDGGSPWNSADGVVLMVGKNQAAYDSTPPPAGNARGFLADGTGYGVHFKTYDSRGILITDGQDTPLRSIWDDSTYTHNSWRQVRVDVQAQGITVFVDGAQKLAWDGPVSTQFKGLGFGAATGAADSEHRIRNVKLTTSSPETCPASAPGPTLTLNGPSSMTLECGQSTYVELGAVAQDGCGGTLEAHRYPEPNTSRKGNYTVTYAATDAHGRTASAQRQVIVDDRTAPTLEPVSPSISLFCETPWSYAAPQASDACDSTVWSKVRMEGAFNGRVNGTYTLTFKVTDSSGNEAQSVQRTVEVFGCH